MAEAANPTQSPSQNAYSENAFGYTKDGAVFIKGRNGQPDRKIGVVKNLPEEALNYFVRRFDLIKTKVDKLCQDIEEADNKGSFLMKLIHMREQLAIYDALGDFEPLYAKLDLYERSIQVLVGLNREKNSDIKAALVEELETTLTDITDWKQVNATVKEIREKWLKTGSVKKELEDAIEGKYQSILDGYFSQRKAYIEQKMALFAERALQYEAIVEKIKNMDREDINPIWAIKQIPKLKEEWKELGALPKTQYDPYIQAFKTHQKNIQRAYKKLRPPANKAPKLSPRELKLLENLKEKQAIIQEVYSLGSIDLKVAFGKTKELQQAWKNIGDVPDQNRNDVNAEFNYACDRIFEMSQLMRTIYVRYRYFHSKSPIEQFSIKIAVMRELIDQDESDLKKAKIAYDEVPNKEDRKDPDVKLAYNRVFTTERKLRVKHVLVNEMQQALAAL